MGYSDSKYYTRPLVPIHFNVTSTSTATASGQVVTSTNVTPATGYLGAPIYNRRTEITGGKVVVKTAPNAGATTTKLALLAGTATFAVATIGTFTAGQAVDLGITSAADAVFAAVASPATINIVSTATASQTVTQGAYDLYLETVERYA